MAGGEIGFGFVVFPDFVEAGDAGFGAQGSLFVDVALGVALEFEEARFLEAVPAVREDDEYFSLLHF